MKKNNKGFTLVELLAVIVILAVLLLLALPQALRLMENAKKDAFIVEAESLTKSAKTAYAAGDTDTAVADCWTYEELSDYVKVKEGYSGKVVRTVDAAQNSVFTVSIANDDFVITAQNGENEMERTVVTEQTTPATAFTCA